MKNNIDFKISAKGKAQGYRIVKNTITGYREIKKNGVCIDELEEPKNIGDLKQEGVLIVGLVQ